MQLAESYNSKQKIIETDRQVCYWIGNDHIRMLNICEEILHEISARP